MSQLNGSTVTNHVLNLKGTETEGFTNPGTVIFSAELHHSMDSMWPESEKKRGKKAQPSKNQKGHKQAKILILTLSIQWPEYK